MTAKLEADHKLTLYDDVLAQGRFKGGMEFRVSVTPSGAMILRSNEPRRKPLMEHLRGLQGLELGTAAMHPDEFEQQGRAFMPIPFEEENLATTKLLEPGQTETVKLKVPSQPGEYEFVCTFRGHALLMWGTLSVTK